MANILSHFGCVVNFSFEMVKDKGYCRLSDNWEN